MYSWSLSFLKTSQTVSNIRTRGDENHLCGASLRKSHKISLKAHRHVCVHGVCTPIARPEKLPDSESIIDC